MRSRARSSACCARASASSSTSNDAGTGHTAAPRQRGRHGNARPLGRAFVHSQHHISHPRHHPSTASPRPQGEITMSATTTNTRLQQWVDEWAAILQPDRVHWCDGSAEEYEQLCQELVDGGTFTKLDEAKRPNSYWAHSDPGDVARVEDRTFICSERRGRRRPEQQLARPGRDARRDDRAVHRRHAGPHHVRGAVLHGPARLAHRPHRRAAHRLGLRGRQHAHHDPHGPGRARRARRRPVGAVRALGRRTAAAGRGRRARGRATPTTSTSSTSPRPARS